MIMNEELLKKVAVLQIKQQTIQAGEDVLTELSDIQALQDLTSDLEAFIGQHYKAGNIPSDPLKYLQGRLGKMVDLLYSLERWQEECLTTLAPFKVRNPAVSLPQIQSKKKEIVSMAQEEQAKIMAILTQCDRRDWIVEGRSIRLNPYLEKFKHDFLPEFAKYRGNNEPYLLKEGLGLEASLRLDELEDVHQQQSSAITKIDTMLLQGNYKSAQALAKEVGLLSITNTSLVGFLDIEFKSRAEAIRIRDEVVQRLNPSRISGREIATEIIEASEGMLAGAQGEFREDLNSGISALREVMVKAEEDLKARNKILIITAIAVASILVLGVSRFVYSAAQKKEAKAAEARVVAEQQAADEAAFLADEAAFLGGDYSVAYKVAKRAILEGLIYNLGNYSGWVKEMNRNNTLRKLYQYDFRCKMSGLAVAWHANGQKKYVKNYVDGKEHGLSTEWYENGQKKSEENDKDGKMHGLSTRWDKEGNITYQSKWENGKKVE